MKFKCEVCGKESNVKYGSGRFCSFNCKQKYASLKSHEAAKIFKYQNNFKAKRSPYGTWKCECCKLIFDTRKQLSKHNHQFHPTIKGSSWNKGLTKETDLRVAKYVETNKERNNYAFNKGKRMSDKQKLKISLKMKKYFKEHPDKVPYLLNHSSKESYPEQYFRNAFLIEKYPSFVQDKYVNGYFLDFAFEDSNTYVEIDGEQHYVDKNIVRHDIIRTKILNQTKWKCIARIRWSKFQKLNHEQRHKFLVGLKSKILCK